MSPNLEVLRYPVGKFIMPTEFSPEQLDHWIADIDHFASAVRHGVEGLSDHQIDIPYREGGWSIRQLVHKRWASLLRRVEDWSLFYIHPEYHHRYRLDQMLALYHWHGNHHLGQITGLREHMGW